MGFYDEMSPEVLKAWASIGHSGVCVHSVTHGDCAGCQRRVALLERDHWIRLFNRLQGAVQHHKDGKDPHWADAEDEALWAAMDRVLRDAAEGPA